MSLLRILVAAAVTLTASPVVRHVVIVAPAHVVAPAATQALTEVDEAEVRVEIGPAVLRIYDENGNVVAVE